MRFEQAGEIIELSLVFGGERGRFFFEADGQIDAGGAAFGHQVHRDIAAGQGLRLRPLPVVGMGAVIGRAAGADAMLLTPAHQFPLGVTLHPRRDGRWPTGAAW